MAKKFNFKRILSLVMALTMATSLLPMGALATGSEGGEGGSTPEPEYVCQIIGHTHGDVCKHVHKDSCYPITCGMTTEDIDCTETHAHVEACKHVHSECADESVCPEYECNDAHHTDACKHTHSTECFGAANCGKEEGVTVDCTSERVTTGYDSLAAAITAANSDTSNETIVIELLKDTSFDAAMTISRDITITSGFTVTGGFTVTRDDAYTGTLFNVAKGATLTLDGLTIDGNNNWTLREEDYMKALRNAEVVPDNATTAYNRFVEAEEGAPVLTTSAFVVNGNLVLNGGTVIKNHTIANGDNKYVISVSASGTLTMNDTVLKHNAKCGSQTLVNVSAGGTWTVEDAEITDNFGFGNGCLASVQGKCCINDIDFYKNYGFSNGMIRAYGASSYVKFNDGEFHDNYMIADANNNWNAMFYIHNTGPVFVMNGGSLSGNTGTQCGGLSAKQEGTLPSITVNGGVIDNNICTNPNIGQGKDIVLGNPITVNNKLETGEVRLFNDFTNKGIVNADVIYLHGWLGKSIEYNGEGTVNGDVYIFRHAETVMESGAWKDGMVVVDAADTIDKNSSLTVKNGATIDGVQVRVLNSVASGNYLNAEESAAAQAASYVEEDGANVKSPVLFYHRLTADQKQTTVTTDDGATQKQQKIVVTFDYNGGLDAQGWSGCQIASDEAFAPELPAPTRDGYILAGWNYAEDNDPECLTMDGDTPYKGKEISQSLRLIAQWTKDSSNPDPVGPDTPEKDIPKDKTATKLENDISDVTLTVGGSSKGMDTDVVFILGGSVAANEAFVNSMIDAFKPVLDTGAKLKLGVVVFADKPNDIALDLNSAEAVLTSENVDAKVAEVLQRAQQPEAATNLEGALIKARDMLAKDTSVSADRKYMFVISTGLTHFFSDDNGYDATIAIQDSDGDYIYGARAWQKYRNAFTHNTYNGTSASMYPVPGAYADNWMAYWADIEKWIAADGDKYVYSIGNQTYAEWYANNSTENKIGGDRRGLLISSPAATAGVPNFSLGTNPRTEGSPAAHALNYERAQYEAWVVYNQMQTPVGESFTSVLSADPIQGLGYNCYAVGSMGVYWRNGAESLVNPEAKGGTQYWKYDTETQIGHSFMNFLNGGEPVPMYSSALGEDSFASIKNDILHSVSAGSRVVDIIGNDFDFINSKDAITLKVGTTEYKASLVTPTAGATSTYSFNEGKHTVDYYAEAVDGEQFVWTIGENVYSSAPVSLSYKVKLVNKETASGTYTVPTNEKAVLYPVDSNQVERDGELFPVPTVDYTVSNSNTGGGGGGGGVVDIPLAPIPEAFTADHYAYIIGYPKDYETGERTKDQTRMPVEPQGNITRAEVATIFFRLLDDQVRELNMVSKNDFSDVNKGQWFNNAISTMASMGIVNGYPDGTFRPNGKITRAEFAAIAARFNASASTDGDYFTDIAGHWGEDEIYKATNSGWIKGYEDNTFKPNQLITRAEAMTLVNRVLHRLPETIDDLHDDMLKWVDNMDTSKWYYLAVQEATNSHDYTRDPSNIDYETWTEMREARDWSELEY
ncbi:MAG: S-layer homology domain-containing protein [Ruminiclostridium sp.]|nr:S-layer homology domain-containing protein [Ruminiclostridium sp.]